MSNCENWSEDQTRAVCPPSLIGKWRLAGFTSWTFFISEQCSESVLSLNVLLTWLETAAVFSRGSGSRKRWEKRRTKRRSAAGGWRDLERLSPSRDDDWMRGIRDGAWHNWNQQLLPHRGGRGEKRKEGATVWLRGWKETDRTFIVDLFFFSDLLPAVMISQLDDASITQRSVFPSSFISKNTFQDLNCRRWSVTQLQSCQPAVCQRPHLFKTGSWSNFSCRVVCTAEITDKTFLFPNHRKKESRVTDEVCF